MHKAFTLAALVLGLSVSSSHAQSKVPVLQGDWQLYRIGTVKRPVLIERRGAPTLRFEGNRVLGTTGCNSYFGTISQKGSSVSIGALGSTRRACASKVLSVLEGRYLKSLGQARTVSLSGPVLVLLTRDGQVLAFRQGK